MATRGREVLRGKLYYKAKKTNGAPKKKKVVAAFCGLGSSDGTSKTICAQIQVYDDYEKIDKPGSKPKNMIRLEGTKIESSYLASNSNSPAYSSTIASPQSGAMRISESPSTSLESSSSQGGTLNGSDMYIFMITTTNGDSHEFKTENESERLRWVKLLQLLVMYPFSIIPEEPKTNPIKDSFRNSLEAKQYEADSVWPVYILPEEVGSKKGMIGLHILVLRSGIPNYTMGQLDILSPTDLSQPVVTWDRDKMRRTGKTGHLVFIEIGRRCEGGPGLVWMYTGYQNDAQALRETLHKFLFQGDGRAIAMNSQPQSLYDVPRASFDSQQNSSSVTRRRSSSSSSGYHNHLLNRSKSHDHDSGFHSMGSSEKTPPTLEGPPVRLDKHPSIRRKRDSDPCVIARSNSIQSPCNSFSERELSEPLFDIDPHSESSESPPDETDGCITGQMDGDGESGEKHLYDVVRTRRHPYYTAHAPPEGNGPVPEGMQDEYVRMEHPKYRKEGYVFMRPASGGSPKGSPEELKPSPSQNIPVPLPQVGKDEYNTLQHFHSRQSIPRNSLNYETLPTINEGGNPKERPSNYENHPLPQDLKGVVPRVYQPSYENHEGEFRGRRGSHGQESYENVTARSEEMVANSNGNNNERRRLSLKRRSGNMENVCLK